VIAMRAQVWLGRTVARERRQHDAVAEHDRSVATAGRQGIEE